MFFLFLPGPACSQARWAATSSGSGRLVSDVLCGLACVQPLSEFKAARGTENTHSGLQPEGVHACYTAPGLQPGAAFTCCCNPALSPDCGLEAFVHDTSGLITHLHLHRYSRGSQLIYVSRVNSFGTSCPACSDAGVNLASARSFLS